MNKNATFNFGIYKGKTLDQVASTQKGLLYLDSMVDWMKEKGMHIADPTFYEDLVEYVQQPEVAREIEEAIETTEDRNFNTIPRPWWEK